MVAYRKNFIIEKRWAIVAILTGVFLGFGSALICVAWHLVIFGFNIMYIVSPLLAGFAETFISRREYGKSTGAISALLTFIIINGYGWFAPGWIFPKEPVTLSLITIIAIILTLQAAFPTLINYILFVVGVGIFRKFIESLIFLPSRIRGRTLEVEGKKEDKKPSADEIFLDELTVPILSVPRLEEGKTEKYVGLVAGEAVAKEKETEGRVSKLTKIIEPTLLNDFYLGEARKKAIFQMMDEAKSIGANTVIDVLIDYVSMGGLQGSVLIVTATGTAVIVEDEASNFYENSSKKVPESQLNNKNASKADISTNNKENDVSRVIGKTSGDRESISGMNKKINVSSIINRIRISGQIIGKEVVDSSATVIGKVKDAELNLDNNEIEEIIVGKGSAFENLGLSKEKINVPFDTVEQIGDRILIKKISTDIDSNDYYSYIESKIRNIKI